MRKRSARFLASIVIAAALTVGVSTPAVAAQPPSGYRTDQVMATVDNARLGKIPLRRGFWDADILRGFGMDKAWHKHALTSLSAQKSLLASTNNKKQANGNFDLRTYVGKYVCKDQWNCKLTEQMLVHAVYDSTSYTN